MKPEKFILLLLVLFMACTRAIKIKKTEISGKNSVIIDTLKTTNKAKKDTAFSADFGLDLVAQSENDRWGEVSYEDPIDISFDPLTKTWKLLFYFSPEIVTQPLDENSTPYLCGPAGWNDTGKMPQGVFVKLSENGEIKPVDFLEADAIYFEIPDSFFLFRSTKFAVCFSSDKVPFSYLYVLPSPLTVEWGKPGVAYKATFKSGGGIIFFWK